MSTDIVDPRQRFSDISMTEEEANEFMRLEAEIGRPVRKAAMAHFVSVMLRVEDEAELDKIIAFLEKKCCKHDDT